VDEATQTVAVAAGRMTTLPHVPAGSVVEITGVTPPAIADVLWGVPQLPGSVTVVAGETAALSFTVGVAKDDRPVLRAVLESLLSVAAGLDPGRYTPISAERLADAVADAQALLADPGATAGVLSDGVAALTGAIAQLEVKSAAVDKTVLREMYDVARKLSNSDETYTAGSWAKLQGELADAKRVLDNPAATQAQIDQATKRLGAAVAGLVPQQPESFEVAARPVVAKVKLNQSQLRLVKGKTFTLEDAVYYTDKGVHPSYAGKVTWKSSNPKIATVSSNGAVKAKKTGTVTITVTTRELNAAGKKLSASIRVTVVKSKGKAKVSKVTASVPKTMKLGQTAYITGKYTSVKATGVKVKYTSSKPDIVIIDKTGRMIAVSKGTEHIKITAGGKTKTYKITVK
jgi:hypothetical protein